MSRSISQEVVINVYKFQYLYPYGLWKNMSDSLRAKIYYCITYVIFLVINKRVL